MKYISTRGGMAPLPFSDVLLEGLAPDGGLTLPELFPSVSAQTLESWRKLSYPELAAQVLGLYVDDIPAETLGKLVHAAYAPGVFTDEQVVPVKPLQGQTSLLGLSQGPTLAFKDMAMQFLGQVFEYELARRGTTLNIIGATSGDTGSAAIEAFAGLEGVDVFILFPQGRVSEVQRRQMTTPTAANVHALAVEGDFDTCQALVKAMFNDHAFRDRVGLAGVNSINWARVLVQTVYYFTAAVALGAPHRPVDFTVPTGNFGDIYAGEIARRMGLPVGRLVIATNQNDILHRTLETGAYETRGVAPSISPSMDIQVSSNFERLLFDLLDRDGAAVTALMDDLTRTGAFRLPQGALDRLREGFASGRASEDDTLATIARVHAETGEILCPHSAVGVHVAETHLGANPMVTLATAHPAKFPDAVARATGLRPGLPPRMADLFHRPERVTDLPGDLAAIQARIESRRG